MKCRFCSNDLIDVFVDLNDSPPSNSFLKKEDLDRKEERYPLKVYVCNKCFLVQLPEHKDAREIFSDDYVYFSSYSQSWLKHSEAYVSKITSEFGLNSNSLVVEIASNDGYLLQFFKHHEIPVLGIEPTANTAEVAISKGIETRIDFFGVALANELSAEERLADVLLGNNVLAHVPNINDFVAGLKILLKPDGIVTMEFPHLYQLVLNNQFDTIYHEHFSYLSFLTVKSIFEAHGLSLFKVDELETHGGSIRIYAKHFECDKWKVHESVERMIVLEKHAGMDTMAFYAGFQAKTNHIKHNLLTFLQNAANEGKSVVGYGAAAKGNTLLNYCNVDSSQIPFVVDASPHKQGRFLPGTKIPVVSESELKQLQPNYVLILPWNLQDEIANQLSYISEWGGKFVLAIPNLTIH